MPQSTKVHRCIALSRGSERLKTKSVRWLDDFIDRGLETLIGFGAQSLRVELQISVGDGGLMKSITSPVRFPYTVCVQLFICLFS